MKKEPTKQKISISDDLTDARHCIEEEDAQKKGRRKEGYYEQISLYYFTI